MRVSVAFLAALAAAPARPADGPLPFLASYHGLESRYALNSLFLAPGDSVRVSARHAALALRDSGAFAFRPVAGSASAEGDSAWIWRPPAAPGAYTATLRDAVSGDSMVFRAFVMVPAAEERGGYLHGYRIGAYPDRPLRNLSFYEKPRGFIRVDAGMEDLPLSPHFRLGQFLCKQRSGFPKFLVLQEGLLLRLENVLGRLNRAGYPCRTLTIMSGFRTPWYNRAIGNTTSYSVHQWGGAADILLDPRGEAGSMADLNGDGVVDRKDSEILAAFIDRMAQEESGGHYAGGLGRYSATRAHGPFVHVDVRGYQARWGG